MDRISLTILVRWLSLGLLVAWNCAEFIEDKGEGDRVMETPPESPGDEDVSGINAMPEEVAAVGVEVPAGEEGRGRLAGTEGCIRARIGEEDRAGGGVVSSEVEGAEGGVGSERTWSEASCLVLVLPLALRFGIWSNLGSKLAAISSSPPRGESSEVGGGDAGEERGTREGEEDWDEIGIDEEMGS